MTVKNGMMLWTDAYLADTGHLTTLEHGAYLLILMAMWRSPEGKIKADRVTLSRTAKMTLDKWRYVEGTIMSLLIIDGESVTQKRLLQERKIALCKKEKAKAASGIRWQSKPLENNGVAYADASSGHMQNGLFSNAPNPNPAKVSKVEGPRAKRRETPRQQISEDWTPDEKGIAYATERGFDAAKINQLVRACRDYHIKHGTLIAGERGLAATWRTWCENEITFSANRRAKSEKPQPHWMQQRDETEMYLKQMRERARNGTAVTPADRTTVSGSAVSRITSNVHPRPMAAPVDQRSGDIRKSDS